MAKRKNGAEAVSRGFVERPRAARRWIAFVELTTGAPVARADYPEDAR